MCEGHEKYIIRTDILYEREDKICDTPDDRRAYDLFRQAEILEAEGQSHEAAKLFRQMTKLSPALAQIFGL